MNEQINNQPENKKEQVIWEEKNYTEQPKNSEPQELPVKNDITTGTKTELMPKPCENIGTTKFNKKQYQKNYRESHREEARRWRIENREAINKQRREHKRNNPEKTKVDNRRRYLKNKNKNKNKNREKTRKYSNDRYYKHHEKMKKYNNEYRQKNKAEVIKKQRQYRNNNKEYIQAYQKEYRKNNKERLTKYYQDNRLINLEKQKNIRKLAKLNKPQKTKEELAIEEAIQQKIRHERIESRKRYNKEYNKKYRQEHKEDIKQYKNKYEKQKRTTDVNYKLMTNLRTRLTQAIKHNAKRGSAVKDLGCSIEFFNHYIAGKFIPGMSWENYGKVWHLDHIIPLSSFNLENRDEFLKACHYTNYQPLWATTKIARANGDMVSIGNIEKGDKIIQPLQ